MSEDALLAARREVAAGGRHLRGRGLVVGRSGNLSVRVGSVVAISPSGVDYERIEPDDVCLLDLDGTVVDAPSAPSSEWPLHRLVYERTDAAAVVHTHSPAAVGVSVLDTELPAVHYSILQLGGPLRVAGYHTFGSDALAEATAAALDGRSGALLANHGAVTHGATLERAIERAEILEWLADVYLRARTAGDPRILSESELDDVRRAAAARRYAGGQQ